MEIGTTFEHYDKVRNNLTANVFKVDEMISAQVSPLPDLKTLIQTHLFCA
jgi:hypothetical protein